MFRLMFHSPRIAPNTGNAIRMVAATGCELHLVEPLGFSLDDKQLRRAGLDYHEYASMQVHADLDAALEPFRRDAFFADAHRVGRGEPALQIWERPLAEELPVEARRMVLADGRLQVEGR